MVLLPELKNFNSLWIEAIMSLSTSVVFNFHTQWKSHKARYLLTHDGFTYCQHLISKGVLAKGWWTKFWAPVSVFKQ